MKTRQLRNAACIAAVLAIPATAAAATPEIGYWLPMAKVSVTLIKTLVSCPSVGQPQAGIQPVVQSKWTVEEVADADPSALVRVDVSSGFLAKRSNAFSYYPNGTLSGFNASSEGQGGVVISSVLKAASVVLPMLGVGPAWVGGPEIAVPGTRYCSAKTIAALQAVAETEETLRSLEDLISYGQASPAQALALDGIKQRLAARRKKLVVRGSIDFPTNDENAWSGTITTLNIEKAWFTDSSAASVPEAIGFRLGDLEDNHDFKVSVSGLTGTVPAQSNTDKLNPFDDMPQRSLVYRRPRLAMVTVASTDCNDDECREILDLDKPLMIPQWGVMASLPVGSAGLFGSRQASAKFDAFGTPTELSYGSDSGGAAIASTIDAGAGFATAMGNAETAALERQIKRIKLTKELGELQDGAVGE